MNFPEVALKDWENFEKQVANLLTLHGWHVTNEELVASKKVDLIATKRLFWNREFRTAVECKCNTARLRKNDVERIYISYLPVLQSRAVDKILIVSLNGISPAAETYCKHTSEIEHSTYSQLELSVLDFSGYIQGIVSEYRRKGLDSFYIEQRATHPDGNSIRVAEYFQTWLEDSGGNPLAILGGYGMGKSTLALKLAYDLALEHQNTPGARVPILIKLGGLATEQSLEGLLGKHLTAENTIGNYHFDTFMELNRLGQFVLFLDGFDEMKKSMSWDDMRFNFHELFRLIEGKSKIVISGRPTAFLTEEEYAEIINGSKRFGKTIRKIHGAPQFTELLLQSFDGRQVLDFAIGYSRYLASADSHIVPQERIDRLIAALEEKNNPVIRNLANRPVHLRMLVELLSYLDYDYADARVSTLYSEFIDYVIDRELEKRARKRFSAAKRRTFIRSLAWWMWTTGLGDGVSSNNIDSSVFKPYLRDDDDPTDIARDLLSGSILEKKLQSRFYFPHRSFLEFLVAEQLAKEIRAGKMIRWDIFLTAEIGAYLREMFERPEDFRSLLSSVCQYRGHLDNWVIDLLVELAKDPQTLFDTEEFSPWSAVAFSSGLIKGRWSSMGGGAVRDIFKNFVFRYDIEERDAHHFRYLLPFLYLRMKSRLLHGDVNIDGSLYDYMKNKFGLGKNGEIRIDGSELVSGLNEGYCFVSSWRRLIAKNEFLRAKARITKSR